jgi:FAD/FMN-containing dehydrogenase
MTTTAAAPAATTSPLSLSELAQLRATVRGPVLTADDPALPGAAATWNLTVAVRPHVLVGATSADDVAAAVRYAHATGRAVAVQATGHGTFDTAADAVVVATSRMRDLVVDPGCRTARIGAGLTWKDVVAETSKFGLAPLTGSTSDVGAVGYTLGGGRGRRGRKYGFMADHVRSFEIVTADGVVRRIDAHNESDLFWGVRGAKSSFGIVTEIEVELFPVSSFVAGAIVFDGAHTSAVLHAWREMVRSVPEETSTSFALLRLPDLPHVPPPLRGRLTTHIRFAHLGTDLEADLLLQPIRAVAAAIVDDVHRRPYSEADAIHNDPLPPQPFVESGGMLADLSPAALDALIAAAGPDADLPLTVVEIRLLGGQLSRQPEHPNAVPGRDGAFNLEMIGHASPEAVPAVLAAGQKVLTAIGPDLTGHKLANFIGSTTDPADVMRAYPFGTVARLRALKRTWDPDNVFRIGHVISPAALPGQRTPEEQS